MAQFTVMRWSQVRTSDRASNVASCLWAFNHASCTTSSASGALPVTRWATA